VSSRLTDGGYCKASQDHSHVAFWRADESGFHSFHILDLRSGNIDDVISMWESDPGSGISWDWGWSADSKAIYIEGACGGFYHHRKWEYKQLDLIYLVNTRQMLQVPQQFLPPRK